MIICGADPGKNGALVTLFEDGSTIVDRVPLYQPNVPKGKKSIAKRPDEREWARQWRQSLLFTQPDVFVVERVGAWTGQGVNSIFSFGRSTGFMTALLMYIDVPIHPADPSVWKAKLGLAGMGKQASIHRARELIPSLIPHLTRAMDDGVAEAGLLAYYGLMTIAAR